MESFFRSLKQELTHHEQFNDDEQARSKVFSYIQLFRNRERLHRALDYRPPEMFEKMSGVAKLTCPKNRGGSEIVKSP